MESRIRIGALVSGGGTNLQAIIDACEAGRIPGEIVFVGADKDGVAGLDRARRRGIAAFAVDYGQIIRDYRLSPDKARLPADFDLEQVRARQRLFPADADPLKVTEFLCSRAIAEARLLEAMTPRAPDLLVLAGFMRTLTPYFIDRFNHDPAHPRIMNIHPAILPAFAGLDGYGDTYRYGCKIAGCTVHFVDYGEDSGPIIGQRCFAIMENDSLDAVRKKGLELEWQLYPECVEMFARGRLQTMTTTHTTAQGRVWQRRIVKIAMPPKQCSAA